MGARRTFGRRALAKWFRTELIRPEQGRQRASRSHAKEAVMTTAEGSRRYGRGFGGCVLVAGSGDCGCTGQKSYAGRSGRRHRPDSGEGTDGRLTEAIDLNISAARDTES